MNICPLEIPSQRRSFRENTPPLNKDVDSLVDPPVNEIEGTVAAIWHSVLGLDSNRHP